MVKKIATDIGYGVERWGVWTRVETELRVHEDGDWSNHHRGRVAKAPPS